MPGRSRTLQIYPGARQFGRLSDPGFSQRPQRHFSRKRVDCVGDGSRPNPSPAAPLGTGYDLAVCKNQGTASLRKTQELGFEAGAANPKAGDEAALSLFGQLQSVDYVNAISSPFCGRTAQKPNSTQLYEHDPRRGSAGILTFGLLAYVVWICPCVVCFGIL